MTPADNNPKETALERRRTEGDRLYSPSTARNRDYIREVFLKLMPHQGKILEIGGGAGEHAVYLAEKLPDVVWHSGDPDPTARASIAAWIAHTGLSNMTTPPHAIDVREDQWGVENLGPFDGLVSINMIHIAPFAAAEGLFAGAQKLLKPKGRLFLYGPFSRNGVHTAPSNEAFAASLKMRDASWGVRDLDLDIAPLAEKNALTQTDIVEMPANNLCVVFQKQTND